MRSRPPLPPANCSEETGYPARAIHSLGAPAAACTGQVGQPASIRFLSQTGEQAADFTPEPGLTVALKTPAELAS